MSQLQTKNAVVLGVSTDTVESHKGFVTKEHLNFSLLADTEKKMTAAYGVLGTNGFASRVTFVIGEDGKIRQIDRAVNGQFARGNGTLTTRHGANLALLLSDWKAELGQPVPDFSLADIDGKTVELLPLGKKAGAVLFLGTHSPISHAYEERLRQIASDPEFKDVAFLGVYPNANDTPASIKADAERAMFGFPVARDENNQLADHFKATVTPSVWVVNATGSLVYRGAIDGSADTAHIGTPYLREALEAALAAKPISNADTRATGNPIKRVRKKSKP